MDSVGWVEIVGGGSGGAEGGGDLAGDDAALADAGDDDAILRDGGSKEEIDGLGEGGEQNAPLGRAVIGGLLVATFYTLFFVPVTYSLLRPKPPKDYESEEAK